jgi:hypothetical protein
MELRRFIQEGVNTKCQISMRINAGLSRKSAVITKKYCILVRVLFFFIILDR